MSGTGAGPAGSTTAIAPQGRTDATPPRPAPKAVLALAAIAVVVGLVVGGAIWWSGTGAHLKGAHAAVTMPRLTVGQPYYVGYEIISVGGDVQIESVRAVDPPAGLDARFAMAT